MRVGDKEFHCVRCGFVFFVKVLARAFFCPSCGYLTAREVCA